MNDYEMVPIPEKGRRGKWIALVKAIINAKGKAVVVPQSDFDPNGISQQCKALGYNLHRHRRADRAWLVWVTPLKKGTR